MQKQGFRSVADIPEDVMKSASDVVATLGFDGSGVSNPDFVRDAIARAILAERERCAKVDYEFRLNPVTAEEQAFQDTFPEDVANAAKQAAWLQLLNRGVGAAWVDLALAILAERKRWVA